MPNLNMQVFFYIAKYHLASADSWACSPCLVGGTEHSQGPAQACPKVAAAVLSQTAKVCQLACCASPYCQVAH